MQSPQQRRVRQGGAQGRGSERSSGQRPPGYRVLLATAAADADAIVRTVARDVAGPDEVLSAVEAEVRPALERLLALLDDGPEPPARALIALRAEGGEAARAGVSVERVIDRYLTSGWVLWAAATPLAAEPTALAELGGALLRTADLAAAAIAEGHGRVERELAGRAAAARAELLDELLDPPPGDAAIAHGIRRAVLLGLASDARYRVVVALLRDQDEEPDAERVAAALARPSRGRPVIVPLVGVRHRRLVLILPDGHSDAAVAVALSAGLTGEWYAATSGFVAGLAAVASAHAQAVAALRALVRLDRPGRLVTVDDVLLERALLADEELLAAAIDHELGPLEGAPRGGPALVETLRVWLDAGQNAHATARALGVAPRTITYRLERIEQLLGRPLDGDQVLRLGTALLGRRLLGDQHKK